MDRRGDEYRVTQQSRRVVGFSRFPNIELGVADQASSISQHEAEEQQDGERDADSQRLGGSLTGALVLGQEEKRRKQAADDQDQNENDSEFDEHEKFPVKYQMIMRRT